MENELIMNHLNKVTLVRTQSGNNFELYLKNVLSILDTGNYAESYRDLLWDAEVKEMILNN